MVSREKILIGVTVFLACLTVIFIIAIICVSLSGSEDKHVEEAAPKTCESRACHILSNRMLEMMDTTVDPCENFEEFACGGYRKNFHSPSGAVRVASQDEGEKFVNKVAEMLNFDSVVKGKDKKRENLYHLARTYYQGCMSLQDSRKNKTALYNDLIDRIKSDFDFVFNNSVIEDRNIELFMSRLSLPKRDFIAASSNLTKTGEESFSIILNIEIFLNRNIYPTARDVKKFIAILSTTGNDVWEDMMINMGNISDFVDTIINSPTNASFRGKECDCKAPLSNLDELTGKASFNWTNLVTNLKIKDKLKPLSDVTLEVNCCKMKHIRELLKEKNETWYYIFLVTQMYRYDMFISGGKRSMFSKTSSHHCISNLMKFAQPIVVDMLKQKYLPQNFSDIEKLKNDLQGIALKYTRTKKIMSKENKGLLQAAIKNVETIIGFNNIDVQNYISALEANDKIQNLVMEIKDTDFQTFLKLYTTFLPEIEKFEWNLIKDTKTLFKVMRVLIYGENTMASTEKRFGGTNVLLLPLGALESFNYDPSYPKYLKQSAIGFILARGFAKSLYCNLLRTTIINLAFGYLFKHSEELCTCIKNSYESDYENAYQLSKRDAIDLSGNLVNENLADILASHFTDKLFEEELKTGQKNLVKLPGYLSKYSPKQIFHIHRIQPFCSKYINRNVKNLYKTKRDFARYHVWEFNYQHLINVTAKVSQDFTEAFQCKKGNAMYATNQCML